MPVAWCSAVQQAPQTATVPQRGAAQATTGTTRLKCRGATEITVAAAAWRALLSTGPAAASASTGVIAYHADTPFNVVHVNITMHMNILSAGYAALQGICVLFCALGIAIYVTATTAIHIVTFSPVILTVCFIVATYLMHVHAP